MLNPTAVLVTMTAPFDSVDDTDPSAFEFTDNGVEIEVLSVATEGPDQFSLTLSAPAGLGPFLLDFDQFVSAIPWTYNGGLADVPSWTDFPVTP